MNSLNTVYIVGGDHHNGLGLSRIFGKQGIPVVSLVVGDCKTSFLSKSKYVVDSKVFQSEKEAYDYLSNKPKEGNKAVIIPYSDAAAMELDNRLEEFQGKYYVPSIKGHQGAITQLMDKQNQYDFAKSAGIRMAKTVTFYMDNKTDTMLDDVVLPCIVKPVISAEGDKRDIEICHTLIELEKTINKYKALGYSRALVQEYLSIDYEIDVFGCILKQEPYICQIPTRTIRSWPVEGGTNSFSQIITEASTLENCKSIIQAIRDIGFYGLYDIELFVVDGKIVLNEINFRNSGDVYMGIHQGYYYPYAWYCDVTGEKCKILPNPSYAEFTMTECADIRNVIAHQLGFSKWIKEYLKCKDFALRFKGDMKPALSRYSYYIKQFIQGKRL